MNIVNVLKILPICLLTSFVNAENRALYQDGGGRVEIASADELQPPNAITIEAWIYPTGARTNNWSLIYKEDGVAYDSDRSYTIHFYTNHSAHLFLDNTGTSSWARIYVDYNPPMLQWIHIAATFDSGEGVFKLYRDGELVGSTNKAAQAGGHFDLKGQTIRPSTQPLNFGNTGRNQKTCIDEVRIWNRALTQSEIQSQMLFSLNGNEPGLVGYWNFDDGTANDLTANANHGAFVGTATTIPIDIPGFNVAPSAPTGVSASDGTYADKVRVAWTAAANADSYQVWRHTSEDSGSATELASGIAGSSYDDTTATPGVTYYYWVKAVNAAGASAFSSSDSGYRLAMPSAPTGVSASDGTYTDKVRIAWTATANVDSYQVWRHTSNNSGGASQLATPTGTSYDDTSATASVTYYYWVKAVNAAGASGFSAADIGYLGVVGPLISVNGMVGDTVRVSSSTPLTVLVEVMHLPSGYIGHDVDWWVAAYEHNGGFWYYLNSLMVFTPFDGNFANCMPAYQGALNNLPQYKVAEEVTLSPGTYNIWFAVDYPMDGVLNIYGQVLWSRVTVVVE